ncbi:hypothetical protein TIFTF001_029972 [Ficus carica]|uniref:Uncharacterized protein n=1 Tax=Ficus carica TaxID=3494 RepID=A0AA88DWR7_FICCA|nr:hypothetical protein TIFTF001_029972 [Ficus carica]
MTKYVKVNSRMLSWTSANNVKFDAVMSALTTVGEKQLKCFVMMPTDEELKKSFVAQLYLKNHMVVPHAPRKTYHATEHRDKLRMAGVSKRDSRTGRFNEQKLEELKKGQKKSKKLLRRVLKLLYNLNYNIEGNPTTAYHVSYRHKRNVQKNDSDATQTDSDDLRFGPQDDGFVDSDMGIVADKGVKTTINFLNADKEEGDEEKEIAKDEDDKGENDEIPKQKMSKISRLGQERSRSVVEIGSPGHALMNVKFYALP